MALVSTAVADSFIAVFDAKYIMSSGGRLRRLVTATTTAIPAPSSTRPGSRSTILRCTPSTPVHIASAAPR